MAIEYVDSTQLDSDLTSVANAIRTKGGTSGQLAFPAGFVSAVEAIPTGGGDEQGLLDLMVNYTDSSNRTWSGTIEDNAIKNFSVSASYMNIPLVLKKTIEIQTGDVISITTENATGAGFWANSFMIPIVSYGGIPNGHKILVQANFLLKNGTVATSLTYSGDPVLIYALGIEARTSGISSLSAKVHLDINNVRIF